MRLPKIRKTQSGNSLVKGGTQGVFIVGVIVNKADEKVVTAASMTAEEFGASEVTTPFATIYQDRLYCSATYSETGWEYDLPEKAEKLFNQMHKPDSELQKIQKSGLRKDPDERQYMEDQQPVKRFINLFNEAKFSPKEVATILGFYAEGMSCDEIGRLMKASGGVINKVISRAGAYSSLTYKGAYADHDREMHKARLDGRS